MEREGARPIQPQLEEQYSVQVIEPPEVSGITEPLVLEPFFEPVTDNLILDGDMEAGIEIELPKKKEKQKPEVHDKQWRQDYDMGWNARKENNHIHNVRLFTGWRASSHGVNWFEQGSSGNQSKDKQRKNQGRG